MWVASICKSIVTKIIINHMNFTAIDFETANSKRSSACAIGIMVVENGRIIKEITKLIKPTPDYHNIRVHGITEDMVENEPDFGELWNEIIPQRFKCNINIDLQYTTTRDKFQPCQGYEA